MRVSVVSMSVGVLVSVVVMMVVIMSMVMMMMVVAQRVCSGMEKCSPALIK